MKMIMRSVFGFMAVALAYMALAAGPRSVTGGFWYDTADGRVHITINAVVNEDGTARGEFRRKDPWGDQRWPVQYVGIVGNRAYLSAYDAGGFQYVYVAEDNGEGSNASLDRAMGTFFFFFFPPPGPPVAITPAFYSFLDFLFGFNSMPIGGGNIQIRG